MDRVSYTRPGERPNGQHHHAAPTTSSHPSPFMSSTAQPPTQIPCADPFQANRDPFLPGGGRRGSAGRGSRAWPPTQGNIASQHHSPLDHPPPPPPPPPSQSAHPAPLSAMAMPPPYDQTRRRSLGNAGSPQYGAPIEQPPPPPSYPARAMPPPSSPQTAPPSAHLTSAPRGPPTASPFNGMREVSNSQHRPGMSISAILGGGDERKPPGSPHSSAVGVSSTPRPMQPPSPGRARSSSMRESGDRAMKRSSPSRVFGEPGRVGSEPRRDGTFGSPQFRREPAHGFRTFQPHTQEPPHYTNGNGAPPRPMSQPAEADRLRGLEEAAHRESMLGGRLGGFRPLAEPQPPTRSEPPFRQERPPFHNAVTSHPQERSMFHSPQSERDRHAPGPMRYTPLGGTFGGPPREEAAPLFRAAYPPTSHPAPEPPRESIEERAQEMRRQFSRPSPPPADLHAYDRPRNGFTERPVTVEEHQRMEALHREQQRKESDSSVHKAILNISPEFSRRGRNSPLPQAVQGAQPRYVGPGGDNPGIKMEFGRMFSGLGSGVGSSPHPGYSGNGTGTPSRMSPAARLLDNADLRRSAEVDANRGRGKAGSRLGRRTNGRRSRDELEEGEGRSTPDAQRGNKRSKTGAPNHHHHHHHVHPHHHHHHHHEGTESSNGVNPSRHTSNPLSQANLAASQAHHHHHHHAHPAAHHHHHPPKPMPPARKPTMTVVNKKVLDELAGKPRQHLGTHLYTTKLSPAPAADTLADSQIKYSSKMKPIPVFTGLENSTYTIRVPRYYLTSRRGGGEENHSLEGICRRRQIWGTDIYTDDSDVVAAAIHSGWLKGDFGEYNDDLCELDGSDNNANGGGNGGDGGDDEQPLTLVERPPKPVKMPEGYDAHITILILPPLESYASTNRHYLTSREWKQKHDGMSFMIHSIEFVDEGATNRFVDRSGVARKNRIAMEEAARREAAAGLLLFASGGSGTVRVGA